MLIVLALLAVASHADDCSCWLKFIKILREARNNHARRHSVPAGREDTRRFALGSSWISRRIFRSYRILEQLTGYCGLVPYCLTTGKRARSSQLEILEPSDLSQVNNSRNIYYFTDVFICYSPMADTNGDQGNTNVGDGVPQGTTVYVFHHGEQQVSQHVSPLQTANGLSDVNRTGASPSGPRAGYGDLTLVHCPDATAVSPRSAAQAGLSRVQQLRATTVNASADPVDEDFNDEPSPEWEWTAKNDMAMTANSGGWQDWLLG